MAETFGQLLLKEALPPGTVVTGPIDDKKLKKILYDYAKVNPADAAKRMDKLRELGHKISTSEGLSISLDDITPNYAARNAITKPLLKKLQTVEDVEERRTLIGAAQEQLLEKTKDFGGSQGLAVKSGGRGKPIQLMRSYMATVAPREVTGKVYPWLMHHSYSEGLRPSEMFAGNMEARNNLIAAYTAIVEPGDFSKILVNNMTDQLVLSEDCGTKNGVMMSTDDPNTVDRFLARDVGGLKGGTLITPQVLSQLKKKEQRVMVRSPMTCELNDGICQKCYGHDERGNMHPLGTNIGVRAAQAMSEPLTQFTLSARHAVRRAGSDEKRIAGMKGVRALLEIPESFTNKATLSPVHGKVTSVATAPQGGNYVTVGTEKMYVPPHLSPKVRKGDEVHPGDALSDGVPMPNEVVAYKGLGAGRKYVVDQMHDLYKEQGVDLDKRHFELLARAHLNHVQIERDPERRYLPGEVVNYSTFLSHLSKDNDDVPVQKALGRVLGKPYLQHVPGTTITPEIARDLREAGIKDVSVSKNPPDVRFTMYSVIRNPLLNPDWMARMAHRNIKDTVLEAAQYGQKSNIHGTHPIPAYVYGQEFGEGPRGRY